jgi:hypothetical protein
MLSSKLKLKGQSVDAAVAATVRLIRAFDDL